MDCESSLDDDGEVVWTRLEDSEDDASTSKQHKRRSRSRSRHRSVASLGDALRETGVSNARRRSRRSTGPMSMPPAAPASSSPDATNPPTYAKLPQFVAPLTDGTAPAPPVPAASAVMLVPTSPSPDEHPINYAALPQFSDTAGVSMYLDPVAAARTEPTAAPRAPPRPQEPVTSTPEAVAASRLLAGIRVSAPGPAYQFKSAKKTPASVASKRHRRHRRSVHDESPRRSPSPTPDSTGIRQLKYGSLVKRGHIVRNWKRRTFILTTESLDYYDEAKRKGSVHLSRVIQVSPVPGSAKRKFLFKLSTNVGKDFLIAADTEREREDWVAAIDEAFRRHGDSLRF